jgi:hypothetical protein
MTMCPKPCKNEKHNKNKHDPMTLEAKPEINLFVFAFLRGFVHVVWQNHCILQ